MSDMTVFIVDDDEAVRDSTAAFLAVEGFRPVTFDSAVAFLDQWSPDIQGCLLADIRMPDMDGLALLERLREMGAKLAVVIMTGHGDVPLAVRAMKAGAVDFLEKPVQHEMLLSVLRDAYDVYQSEGKAQEAQHLVDGLTAREREVLEQVVRGHPNKVIAYELDISPRTVEVHRARVMQKMRADSLSQLVRLALLAGIAP